jgi:non-homologous end joining protein Ku
MTDYTLRYSEELRAGRQFSEIKNSKVHPDQLSLVKELIQRNNATFDATKFKDDCEDASRELVDAKGGSKGPVLVALAARKRRSV